MKEIIRVIKKLFGIYERGCEYWVYTDDIKVPLRYKQSKIGSTKWNRKMNYYLRNGEFESPIILDKNFNLVDGFSSVKIAHINGIDKVPIHFVD